MGVFRIRRQLKKRWRRWRRVIWTYSLFILIAALAWTGQHMTEQMKTLLTRSVVGKQLAKETLTYLQSTDEEAVDQKLFMQRLNNADQKLNVHLRTTYVCGEEIENVGRLDASGIYSLMNEHPAWRGSLDQKGDVWLDETVSDDLSPACKGSAYMSIDDNGNLTLFDGPPKEEKVIRTFFQLDISSMESTLPQDVLKQLQDGIRIQDIDEYHSVLSTFSDYAAGRAEGVMKSE